MIELYISHAAREAGRGKEWYCTGNTTERFPTRTDAIAWCRDMLGRRWVPMYCDTTDGGSRETGRVYSSLAREAGRTYYKQYWVSMAEIAVTPIRGAWSHERTAV
jgi:hypothetical protein